MHDPRVGRFFAIDPLESKYPHNSPYAFSENDVIAHVELEGLEKATPEQIKSAQDAINNFENDDTTESSWSNIDKKTFVNSLRSTLNKPSIIDQSNTNLCGVAAVTKIGLENDPYEVVNMAIGLYRYGKYGNYESDDDMMKSKPTNGLSPFSYVVLGSIRNSITVGGYDPSTDWGWGGFTTPLEIPQIAKSLNLEVQKITDVNVVNNMAQAINSKNFVIALINTSRFEDPSSFSIGPNHYIQITGIRGPLRGSTDKGKYEVSWWSWGEEQPKMKMSISELNSSIYEIFTFK